MKLIYVAGPYRAETPAGRTENILHAASAAMKLWRDGWAVICPHMNTAHFDGCVSDETFLAGDLAILERCDAIYMLRDWDKSLGARTELAVAQEQGIEVYYE